MIPFFPAPPAQINLAGLLLQLFPTLNAAGLADLVFWTEDELFTHMDEAAQQLARTVGAFVTRDTSTAIVVGTAAYALPPRHLSTIQLAVNGAVLQPATHAELEALDATWVDTTGNPPTRYVHGDGIDAVRLYPTPATGATGTVDIVLHQYPPELSASNSTLSAPTVLREYLTWRTLAAARRRESKGAMPEVSQWFEGLANIFVDAAKGYWGEAQ